MHYSGNLDIVVNVPMTEAFLEHVEWSGQQEYRRVLAETYKWAGTVCIYYSDLWPRNSEEPWKDLKHGDGAVLP